MLFLLNRQVTLTMHHDDREGQGAIFTDIFYSTHPLFLTIINPSYKENETYFKQ